MTISTQRFGILAALRFALRWSGRILFALAIFYGSFLALGCVPVNRSFVPATGEDRVVIYVRSNEIHTDLVLPVVHAPSGHHWREHFPPADFRGDVRDCQHIAIGWGNRAFYIDTPTWADFKISTAARALFWPSDSVLHVEYVAEIYPREYFREVAITAEQYRRLVDFIDSSAIKNNNGCAVSASERTYGPQDRFYESSGNYHALNTCNQWTGRGLQRAGVTTGLWTPLKPQVLYWLPETPPRISE